MDTKAFKTKTMFINRDNGQLSGIWLNGLDIGYSSVKVFSPNKVGIFPAYACPYINRGTIGDLPSDFITYTDLDTNESWLVGYAAQQKVASDNTSDTDASLFGRQRYFDPMYKVIARVGLGIGMISNKYGERGNKRVVVKTGLPPKYREDAPYIREVLSGRHHFSVKIGNGQPQEFDFTISSDDIYVTLQPIGTLISVSTANNHQYVEAAKEYLNKNIIIFDAGFGTLDLFSVTKHQIDDDGHTFGNLGMKRVFANTIAAFQEAEVKKSRENPNKRYAEIPITITGMQQCLEDGYIRGFNRATFSTDDIAFDTYLENAVKEVCNEAIEMMFQVYPMDKASYLVITGGTGAAWNKMIREKLSGMRTLTILDGNQNDTSLPVVFANVRGYYMDQYAKLYNQLSKG